MGGYPGIGGRIKSERVGASNRNRWANHPGIRNWGFGLCFLYLRNVQGYGWNHKRVYRIYCELELNLRIKPKKRLKRDKPEPLSVPDKPNETWSMDFMEDQLADGARSGH